MTYYAIHWLVRVLYFTLGVLWLLALLPWLMPEPPARPLYRLEVPELPALDPHGRIVL